MPPHLWPPDAPCWGCEPLLADPSLYADLRRLSEDRASLALHPDRVANTGMDTVRRAEAVEVFKVISAAYDTERLSA